jgi:oligopeptide transport system substrate-binding protein
MRVRSRYGTVVIGVAALALGLSACGGGDPEAAGEVTINGSEPENPLIPSNTNETGGGNVIDSLFTRLVSYNDETAAPELAMAESIESNEDYTVWTVKIKDGWTFHDGTDVTAQSFVDAWNWSSYGPNAQLNSYFFGADGLGIKGFDEVQGEDKNGDELVTADEAPVAEMSGLKVVDDTTFEVTLEGPNTLFDTIVGYTAFAPLPEALFSDANCAPVFKQDADNPEGNCQFGEAPIGNGPFKFVQWDKKQQIKATAFDEYKGDDKPNVKDVTWKIYQDLDAAYADLLAGNLDILDSIPTSARVDDQFKQDLGDRQVVQSTGVIQTMAFPLYVKGYDNPDLRKAVSMAFDREEVIKVAFPGRLPATSLASPVVEGFVEGACGETCTYQPEMAKELFAKSGFTGSLTLSYNADGDHKTWTEAVCNGVKNTLGVECTATPVVDFATLRQQVNDRAMTGLFRNGWVMDYPSIENFLAPIYATDASSNDNPYSNPEVDALLKSAKGKQKDEAIADYQKAEQLILADLPSVPLWYGDLVAGWSEAVSNVKFSPFDRVVVTELEKN